MFRFSQRSNQRMEGINVSLLLIAHEALKITKIDFGIPHLGGFRTAQEQRQLFDDGKTKADGLINLSNHQSGNALDFYAWVDGKPSWEKEHLAQVACAFFQVASKLDEKIEWGGLWHSIVDMPHIQLILKDK